MHAITPIAEAVRLVEQALVLLRPLAGGGHQAESWRLTAREADVLRLLREGRSNREIGAALGISVHTARTHVSRVLAKLYLRSRWQLVAHGGTRAGLKATRRGQILEIRRRFASQASDAFSVSSREQPRTR